MCILPFHRPLLHVFVQRLEIIHIHFIFGGYMMLYKTQHKNYLFKLQKLVIDRNPLKIM